MRERERGGGGGGRGRRERERERERERANTQKQIHKRKGKQAVQRAVKLTPAQHRPIQEPNDVTRGPRPLSLWHHSPLYSHYIHQYACAQYKGHYKAEVHLNKSQK